MQRNHGIDVNGEKICALLYADDLLIIGQSAEQLQDLLDSMYGWCRKWKLLINVSKSNIIHFRKPGTKETNYMFKWGQVPLEKVNCYKYLGLYLFSDMNFSKTARFLSESVCGCLFVNCCHLMSASARRTETGGELIPRHLPTMRELRSGYHKW